MATASLAKTAGVVGAFEKYKEQLLAPVTEPFSESAGVDFLGFCDPKSKNLDDLIAAGINPGSAYVRANGKYEKLALPFDFHLLAARQLWVNFDQTGQVIGVTDTDPRSWTSPYKENIETAVLVYTSHGVIPVKATFRTTKAQPARIAKKELDNAATKEWASIDKAHAAVAGAFPLGTFPPGLRFTVQVQLNKGTSKGKGLPQYVALGKLVLTTPEKSKELETYFSSKEAASGVTGVMDAFTNRVKELTDKIKKG